MESRGYERSSEIRGWRGSLSDIAALAGRVGEILGGREVASLVIIEKGGKRLDFSGPNQLRAVADTIDPGLVEAIEIHGRRGAPLGGSATADFVSLRASPVNKRWRSGGIELLVTGPSQQDVTRVLADMERAIGQRVATRRLSWIGRATGRPSVSLIAERRRSRPTRIGRAIEAGIDVGFEALGAAVLAVIVLVVVRLL